MVEASFPDATYESGNATREDYSQTLGARAAAALPGASVARWKRGAPSSLGSGIPGQLQDLF